MDVRVGDILEMKKPHPCGSGEWTVLRVEAVPGHPVGDGF